MDVLNPNKVMKTCYILVHKTRVECFFIAVRLTDFIHTTSSINVFICECQYRNCPLEGTTGYYYKILSRTRTKLPQHCNKSNSCPWMNCSAIRTLVEEKRNVWKHWKRGTGWTNQTLLVRTNWVHSQWHKTNDSQRARSPNTHGIKLRELFEPNRRLIVLSSWIWMENKRKAVSKQQTRRRIYFHMWVSSFWAEPENVTMAT